MTKLKVRMRFFLFIGAAISLAACGGQAESDALISSTQAQFYARTMQAQAAQAPAAQTPPAPAVNDVPAVEAIPAMPIPESSSAVPAVPAVSPPQT